MYWSNKILPSIDKINYKIYNYIDKHYHSTWEPGEKYAERTYIQSDTIKLTTINTEGRMTYQFDRYIKDIARHYYNLIDTIATPDFGKLIEKIAHIQHLQTEINKIIGELNAHDPWHMIDLLKLDLTKLR